MLSTKENTKENTKEENTENNTEETKLLPKSNLKSSDSKCRRFVPRVLTGVLNSTTGIFATGIFKDSMDRVFTKSFKNNYITGKVSGNDVVEAPWCTDLVKFLQQNKSVIPDFIQNSLIEGASAAVLLCLACYLAEQAGKTGKTRYLLAALLLLLGGIGGLTLAQLYSEKSAKNAGNFAGFWAGFSETCDPIGSQPCANITTTNFQCSRDNPFVQARKTLPESNPAFGIFFLMAAVLLTTLGVGFGFITGKLQRNNRNDPQEQPTLNLNYKPV